MNIRLLSGIAAAALLVAACGPSSSDSSTSVPGEVPDAAVLGYSLTSGTTVSYQVDLDEHLDLAGSGDASVGAEGFPGDASIDVTGSATFTQEVSDGPDPDTHEVHITGEFTDLAVSGTVDGEDVDEVPDFAEMEPIDVTFVVDAQGNVVSDGSDESDPMGSILGNLGSVGSGMTGIDPGQFVGPALSDEAVTVGDTWSEKTETPLFGEDVLTTNVTSTVTGTDEVDGHEVLVIETETEISDISLDLADFFAGFLGGFLEEGESDPEVDDLLEQIKFAISVKDAAGNSTTLFDPAEGAARQFDVSSSGSISLDINVPDEETGDMVSSQLEMTLSQQISYTLLDDSGD